MFLLTNPPFNHLILDMSISKAPHVAPLNQHLLRPTPAQLIPCPFIALSATVADPSIFHGWLSPGSQGGHGPWGRRPGKCLGKEVCFFLRWPFYDILWRERCGFSSIFWFWIHWTSHQKWISNAVSMSLFQVTELRKSGDQHEDLGVWEVWNSELVGALEQDFYFLIYWE